MRRFAKPADEEENEIDLTPMLDVVFIMLIFFIVTATFVNEVAVDFNRPDSTDDTPPPPDAPQNAVINVSSSNVIEMGGRRIDIRSVEANVRRVLAENPQAAVIIIAAETADSGVFVEVTDAARAAAPGVPVQLVVEGE
ncbi:MAG: biopolymer transporter ExbD [Gammaproteobacteria bacterium]|jgi:biopolymer transport protein ExbD|nr:biopolymer transporter ExbD [Gammaproteobacteria bacterium]